LIQKDVKTALDKNNVLIAVTRQAPITRTEPAVPGNTRPKEERPPSEQSHNPPLEERSKSSASVSERKISGRG